MIIFIYKAYSKFSRIDFLKLNDWVMRYECLKDFKYRVSNYPLRTCVNLCFKHHPVRFEIIYYPKCWNNVYI